SISALLLILCAHRILTFTPQPLDSPGSLRPFLYALFGRFLKRYSNPEQAQQAWGTYCIVALLIPTILALLNYLLRHSVIQSPVWVQKVAGSRLLFFGSVAACRAVDCGTSGPLNIFPLMLPALLGFSPDYASARLIALVIIFISIYLIYRTFALLADEAVARVALLPAAGAFAVIKHRDFHYYISEHVSLILLALAVYVCVKTF